MKRKLILNISCLWLLFTNVALAQNLPVVIVDPVIKSEVNETREIISRVVSQQDGTISAEINGIIKEVLVKTGDKILHNQIIAMLDPSRMHIALELAKAQAKTALANFKSASINTQLAKLQLNRQIELQHTPAFSKAIFEDLENAFFDAQANQEAASATLEEKRAELALARLNLEHTKIKAPFSGIVSNKMINPGVYVSPGTKLIELVNTQDLELEFDIPSQQVAAIKNTNQYSVLLHPGSKTFYATLRGIILKENEASRTLSVRLTPSRPLSAQLIVNQSLIVITPLYNQINSLTVHKDAIISTSSGIHVFIVENGKVQLTKIKIGVAIENRFTVIQGLSLGDLVVTRGNERLRDGQLVSSELMQE